MKHSSVFIGIAVLLAAFLSGCAHQGPILLDFGYQAPKGETAAPPKVTVGVSPFKDDRGKAASVVGKRSLGLSNQTNDLVVQGTAAERVTAALKSALQARSIAVKDVPAWDLTDAGIPADGGDLLISGEIKTLWVEATAEHVANTAVKADVQLRIVVADTAQKKILRVLNVNSKLDRGTVASSFPFVGKTLSEALTTAVDQIFADEELKNRLK
jgi:hypothetical protein